MIQAFYTGINGIKTHQQAIDVVSDNLANISTVGFRSYSAEFSSMFEEALNTPSNLSSLDSGVGLGSKINMVSMNEKAGSYMLTERSTDLAILGDGWFGIELEDTTLYTRDGSFTFDANRDLVTNDGLYVLGTMGTNISNGVLTQQVSSTPLSGASSQERLKFPNTLEFPAEPTTEAMFYGNLGTEDVVRVISAEAVDAQSNKNSIRLEFRRSVPQVEPGSQWDVVATAQSLDGTTIYDTEAGVVSFDEAGALISSTLSSISNNGSTVSLNLGSAYAGVSSTSNEFYASSSSNGIEAGELMGYEINQNAEVIATFTNGLQSSVGAIAVYHFTNDKGLERYSGSRFAESANSGKPLFYTDENGQYITGTDIANFKLESSNVEMEVGMTELIILQRSYDANSKSITTADEMLQKALNMSSK